MTPPQGRLAGYGKCPRPQVRQSAYGGQASRRINVGAKRWGSFVPGHLFDVPFFCCANVISGGEMSFFEFFEKFRHHFGCAFSLLLRL
jgi:hypothetical protein